MWDLILKVIDDAKVPVIVFALTAFLSSVVCIQFRDSYILAGFMSDYGNLVGFGLVVSGVLSGVLLTFKVGPWFWRLMRGARREAAMKKAVRSSIDALDNQEKAVLREFYIQEKSTILLPITDPVVEGLLWKNIIVSASHYGKNSLVGMLSPVNLSPFASTLINPQTVGIPLGKLTQEQINEIKNSRPDFVARMGYQDYKVFRMC